MKFLTSVALLLGLGGVSDRITINEVIQKAEAKIQATLHYHTAIPEETVANVRASIRQKINDARIDDAIEVKAVPALLKDIEQELILGSVSDTINLPLGLRHYRNVFQLRAFHQLDNSSCGFWSLINARIIQLILNNNRQLDSAIIRNVADNYITNHRIPSGHYLEPDEVVEAAARMNLDNFHVLIAPTDDAGMTIWLQNYYNRIEEEILQVGGQLAEQQDADLFNDAMRHLQDEGFDAQILVNLKQQMDNFVLGLKNQFDNDYVNTNLPGALHFACNLSFNNRGWHWILISIVKLVDRKPIMIILDSANFTLNTQAKAYAQYLYDIFIKPHEDMVFL